MVYREYPGGWVAITQPAHALLAGCMAESWGNKQFPEAAPYGEVCMAAKIHDIGWQEWELAPTLNPETGRPHGFDEMPDEAHLAIWTESCRMSVTLSRHIGLLVSLHHSGLYAMYNEKRPIPTAAMVRFRNEQQQFQSSLLDSLRADAARAPWCDPEVLQRNQGIIRACDALSLFLCMNQDSLRTITGVPGRHGAVTLFVDPPGAAEEPFLIKPWPFRESRLDFEVEGRRLEETYFSEEAMRTGLAEAAWVRLTIRLAPA